MARDGAVNFLYHALVSPHVFTKALFAIDAHGQHQHLTCVVRKLECASFSATSKQHEIKERCAFMKHNHNPQALATDWRKLLAEMKNADAFS